MPHSIFCLTYLRGINGLKPNTVWQLTAADEGLRFISNMPFSKDEFIVPYDHLVYFRRRPDWYFQGVRNATARAIAGSALNGELGAVSAVIQDFSLLAAQRPALNHPLCGWRQTALQSHPSDRY